MLDEFRSSLDDMLGPEEKSVIDKTKDLVKGGFPILKSELSRWLSKAVSVKEELSFLISSVNYRKSMVFTKMSECYIKNFPLPEVEDLKYSSREDRVAAVLYFSEEYRSLKEEYDFLVSLQQYLENLLWSINTMVDRAGEGLL